MSKAVYQSKFISLKEAADLFGQPDDLLLALKEGAIQAEGRYSTDADYVAFADGNVALNEGEEEPTYPYAAVPTHEWEKGKVWFDLSRVNREYGKNQNGMYGYCLYDEVRLPRKEVMAIVADAPAIKKPVSQKRTNELHELIGDLVKKLEQEKGRSPKAKEVWDYLETNCHHYSIIDEITTDDGGTIHWTSLYKNEQTINRASFHNLVSKMKKKKADI